MSTDWYYQANGREVGPISSSTLKQLADGGILSPETAVRRGCDVTWTTAKHVRGLLPGPATVGRSASSAEDASSETELDESEIVAWLDHNETRIGMGPFDSDWGATLVNGYRANYIQAMHVIDDDVGQLIRDGKEMKALRLLDETMAKIVEIHEALGSCYGVLWNNLAVLQHFGSERLQRFDHRPLPIRAFLKDQYASDEETEQFVLATFRNHGICKSHWLLKEVMIAEIEYMLDALRILMEPDFSPG